MLSFLIPWRGNINEPLRSKAFGFVFGKIKVGFPNAEVIVADSNPDRPFNRSEARNNAAARATGNVYVFTDADSLVSARKQIHHAVAQARLHAWSFPYERYCALNQFGTDMMFLHCFKDNPLYVEHYFPGEDAFDKPPSVGGCVVVTPEAFEMVGGYDERFQGWGYEDRAFADSLRTLVGPEHRISGDIYHLYHEAPEQNRFGQPDIEFNRYLYRQYGDVAGSPDLMQNVVTAKLLARRQEKG